MQDIGNLITEQGLAVGLLVVALAVIGWLARALLKEKDGRRADALSFQREVIELAHTTKMSNDALANLVRGMISHD